MGNNKMIYYLARDNDNMVWLHTKKPVLLNGYWARLAKQVCCHHILEIDQDLDIVKQVPVDHPHTIIKVKVNFEEIN
jgi:hypothetical protein